MSKDEKKLIHLERYCTSFKFGEIKLRQLMKALSLIAFFI
jgi:hypothetical protein